MVECLVYTMRGTTLTSAAIACLVVLLSGHVYGRPRARDPGYVRMVEQEDHPYMRPVQKKRESPTLRRHIVERPSARMGNSGYPEDFQRRRLVRSDQVASDSSDQIMYHTIQRSKPHMGHDQKQKKQRYRIYNPEFGMYGDEWQNDMSFKRHGPLKELRRMKSPPKKRENSIDRGFEGESVIIRYVPVLKNGGHNSVFYGTNSNEDSDLLQSYYDEQLTHSSHNEECPHCKNRYTHPYYHHHNHHHHEYEENTPNYTYQQHPSTYPHIDDSQDLTRTADVLSQYYNVPTLDYSITEHPISQMTTDHKIGQNHLRHFTDLHEILDETHSPHSEEVKDVVTSPTTDIQQAGRRGRYLELKASEGIPDETMAHVMGHQVARDYGDNSEDTTKANEETLMGLEDSGMKATDVLGILTKSPISVGGQK